VTELDRLSRVIGTATRSVRPVAGGSICRAVRAELADGRSVFGKSARGSAPAGFFAAEANGLRWLAQAPGGPPVPELLGFDDELLALSWVEPGPATPATAERFGRELAALHAAGAEGFGAAWPGFIGSAPMDNTAELDWPRFYAARRVMPYVRTLREDGVLSGTGSFDRLAERLPALAGPPEPPARLHGDLWNGNVLWSAGRGWLVDPAAHGGHRETDLAMLRLFGAPHLDRILASYAEAAEQAGAPLSPGCAERVELHQLFPLLVHAVLFGGGYVGRAVAIAHRYGG
jgi:fructosamine-3-kinase